MKFSAYLLFGLFILFSCHSIAQTPHWAWCKTGVSNHGYATSEAIDDAGYIYQTGFFEDTISFMGYHLNGGGAFLVKYDAGGNLIWAKKYGHQAYANGLLINGNAGLYFWGSCSGSEIFGSTTLSANANCFFARLDTAGNIIWVKEMPHNAMLSASLGFNAMTVDKAGNLYFSGVVRDTAVFDTITVTTTAFSLGNIFVAKYNADGHAVWVKKADNPIGLPYDIGGYFTAYGSQLAMAGKYINAVAFGTDTIIGHSPVVNGTDTQNRFFTIIDSSGNFVTAKNIEIDGFGDIMDIDGDKESFFLSGFFMEQIKIDSIRISNMDTELSAFLARFRPDGNIAWAKKYGYRTSVQKVKVQNNNVYVCGEFRDSAVISNVVLHTPVFRGMYVACYDTAGNLNWIQSCYNKGAYCNMFSVSVSANEDVYTSGFFTDSCYLGTLSLSPTGGSWQPLLAKLSSANHINNNIIAPDVIRVYPNPATTIVTIDVPAAFVYSIKLLSWEGKCLAEKNVGVNETSSYFDVAQFPSGSYILEIGKKSGGVIARSFVISK